MWAESSGCALGAGVDAAGRLFDGGSPVNVNVCLDRLFDGGDGEDRLGRLFDGSTAESTGLLDGEGFSSRAGPES